MSVHGAIRHRPAIGALVVCILLSVSLYIYSPWHQHQADGRQMCRFFQFEHGNGLEAQGQVMVQPPSECYCQTPVQQNSLVAVPDRVQGESRAPPA